MKRTKKTVSREELYELVWSKPATQLAQEYGVSDVGLAKVCKKLEVPRPAVGYWQRLRAGKNPARPELPPLSEYGLSRASIDPQSFSTQIARPSKPEETISGPTTFPRPILW